jgi:serine protease AprX
MRQIHWGGSDTRLSALWGNGKRGGDGRAARSKLAASLAVCALIASMVAGGASASDGSGKDKGKDKLTALVPAQLVADAQANPDKLFDVIVQGDKTRSSADVANDVGSEHGKAMRTYTSITGASAELTGKDLLKLARHPHIDAITPDDALGLAGYRSAEFWRDSGEADVKSLWGSWWNPAPAAPAIAFIDSGIDAGNSDVFENRIVANVSFCSSCTGAEGHGTMVAGIAAGDNALNFGGGVAQQAPIVMLRTANGDGRSYTSDVLAAIDWIMANRQNYNIRVVNLSMAGTTQTSFKTDPLDRAVENLWLNGNIVVVASQGNYGSGSSRDVSYAPGNDPFVITVGATDVGTSTSYTDDSVPSWSAFGHTIDGFQKPEVSAPGRFLMMPTVMGATLTSLFPDRLYCAIFGCALPLPGQSTVMWMSGTSFSAGIVSGIAAQILARHPSWTPDQVKGALMLKARALSCGLAAGVGEVDGTASAAVSAPPNPNENLYQFVVSDSTGKRTFDFNKWSSYVSTTASWSTASWSNASWSAASWSQASWSTASWSQASWTSASWSDGTSSAASWSASGTAASWSD